MEIVNTRRKPKPPVINPAVQVTAENMLEVAHWAGGTVELRRDEQPYISLPDYIAGSLNILVSIGDWVMELRDVDKMIYLRTSETEFEKSYEVVK